MNNKKKITMLFLLTATAIGAYAQATALPESMKLQKW